MKKVMYVEEDFLSPSLCQPFIDLHEKENDSFLETVTHSNSGESLSYAPEIPEPDIVFPLTLKKLLLLSAPVTIREI